MTLSLFESDRIVGVFRGFSEGGIEFHAELTLPYRSDFQCRPMHGQFLLVQLENEAEAVLGRISSISSQGRLASTAGEEYNIRAVRTNRPVAEDIRDEYLRYKIDMRVLGVVKLRDGKFVFAATHRRLPHVGSRVAFPSDSILKELVGHTQSGAELGFLAYGEFIWFLVTSGGNNPFIGQLWTSANSSPLLLA